MASLLRLQLYILMILAAVGWSALPAQAQTDIETISYRVKPGDTLLALAGKYLVSRRTYVEVARLNKIRNDRAIPVGFKLKIPYRLLKFRASTASVAAFRGDASLRKDKLAPVAATVGASFAEGATLSTGQSSSLSIQMEDGSKITLPSNSTVRVTRLRRIFLTDSIDYEFAIDRGGATTKVVPFKKREDRYRMRTPITVSAVRGTEFRNRYEPESQRSLAELLEGGLSLEGAGGDASLAPGTGAIATPTGVRTEKLLPPPELLSGGGTQREANLSFAVQSVPQVSTYRLQIARDSSFIDIAEDVQSPAPQITVGNLDNGNYFARVTAISSEGLEGLPMNFGFKRRLNTLSATSGQSELGYVFRWNSNGDGARQYHFQLFRADLGTAAPTDISTLGTAMVDEPGMTADSIILSDLPPGQYFWRVGTFLFADGDVDQNWTALESVTISAE